jgi:hypothetical protein
MNPKSLSVTLVIALAWAGALLVPTPSGGQTGEEINTTQLLNDITAQQKVIDDNQSQIDTKLAAIGENVRQARIFAGRGK